MSVPGANAVAAGTVNIPGVYLAENVGLGIFAYLASQADGPPARIRDDRGAKPGVSPGHLGVQRAAPRRGPPRGPAAGTRRSTRDCQAHADYAKAGQGREADANRAATQLARREAYIQAAEAEVLTASAKLCRLLNLDPSIRLHPTDAFVVPHPIVPDPMPVAELIALGLLHRPELAAQRAAIQAALMNLDGAKILPFSPTTLVGFSAGGFAGGSNLVRPIFGGMSGRTDLDAIMYWTIQNLGVGNIALIRLADAQLKVTQFQQIEILNRVRADVAEAYARTHARYAQIGTYEDAVRSGYLAYHEDLDRTLFMGGDRPRDVLPIELLNSFDLLANARVEYIDAIVDYNRAQFAMYVALGQPPANSLAHPVPVEGVVPQQCPAAENRAGDGPPAPPNGPQAANAAGSDAARRSPVRMRPARRARSPRQRRTGSGPSAIPPPRDIATVLGATAR